MSRKQGGLHGVPDRFNLSRVVDRGSNPVDRAARSGFRSTRYAERVSLDGHRLSDPTGRVSLDGFHGLKGQRFLCGTQAGSICGG